MLNQQKERIQKYAISCFDDTLNGWFKQSPEKIHKRQYSLLQQLQSNLIRYEDENKKNYKKNIQKQTKYVRLPLLAHTKLNPNTNQMHKSNQQNLCKLQSELNLKKALPLRMKTLTIHQIKENSMKNSKSSKRKKNVDSTTADNEGFRKKITINFQRIKEISQNCLQFSDDRFFRDSINVQKKSKSVKLHMFPE